MARSRSPMRSSRPEVPDFQTTFDALPGSRDFSSMNQQEREVFLTQNRRRLSACQISTVPQLENRVNALQKQSFFSTMTGIVAWPVRNILWPPVRWMLKNPIKTVLIGGAVTYFGAPYVFNLFASAEHRAAAPGLDWLSRLSQARSKLVSGTPPNMTPTPGIPGLTVPPEDR